MFFLDLVNGEVKKYQKNMKIVQEILFRIRSGGKKVLMVSFLFTEK